jgi:hypothetical protein
MPTDLEKPGTVIGLFEFIEDEKPDLRWEK